MIRSLRALALGLLVAPALALPAGATALPAAPTQRTAPLPTSATVHDNRSDGPSRRFDIFWVRGATVGGNFVFTMKVRELTRANTRWVQDANGVYWSKALFTVYLRVNGQKQHAYTVGNSGPHGEAGLTRWENGEPAVGGAIDCSPDPMDSDKGTFARFNYRQNTVRLLVPRACLPDVRRVAVSGLSNDRWGNEFGGKSDYVSAAPGALALRYSGWFSAR